MVKGKAGLVGGGMALAVLLAGSAPTSAFSLFGISFGAPTTTPAAHASALSVLQGGVSAGAQQFINDVIDNADENSCTDFQGQSYQVCTEYLYNAVFDNLVPYYKYANSDDAAAAHFVNNRLSARYVGQANELIRERVASWQPGNYEVDAPSIKVLSINVDTSARSATLQTQESWLVSDEAHNVIYREDSVYHEITLARVPSYLTYKWVVAAID